jgi:hypothetical protein
MNACIHNLTRHYADGFSLPDSLTIDEKARLVANRRGSNLIKLTWECIGKGFELSALFENVNIPLSVSLLPDASGLICFEPTYERPDNCYILDAYGKERFRLRVPWKLTPYDVPPAAKMWFRNIGTHDDGQFGVTAWIEYAGDFYYELDYHEGNFLWGKQIRF